MTELQVELYTVLLYTKLRDSDPRKPLQLLLLLECLWLSWLGRRLRPSEAFLTVYIGQVTPINVYFRYLLQTFLIKLSQKNKKKTEKGFSADEKRS